MFLWTYKVHFWHLCRKFFDKILRKFLLKTGEDIEKWPFFKETSFMKTLLWTGTRSFENRAQKNCAKSSNGFCLNSQNDSEKTVQNIFFNPKRLIGHIRWKFDKTYRNSHRESETIYLEVRKLLGPNTFFQGNFSLNLFRWHRECNFDNTEEQLSSEVRKFLSQNRKRLENSKKNTQFKCPSSKWSSGKWSSASKTLPMKIGQK